MGGGEDITYLHSGSLLVGNNFCAKVFRALVCINFGVCFRGKRSARGVFFFFDKRAKVVCRTSARD